MQNLDNLVSIRQELQELKKNEKEQLEMAIQKAKGMQINISQLSTSMLASLQQINMLQEENNSQLNQMIAQLEGLINIE